MDEREQFIRLKISRVTSSFYDITIFASILICHFAFHEEHATTFLMMVFLARNLIFGISDLYYRRGEVEASSV
jgi:hypothetical protein